MPGIEFIDDSEPGTPQPRQTRRLTVTLRVLLRAVGPVLVAVSIWLPQLSFTFPGSDTYAVNGWGQYSVVGHVHGLYGVSLSGDAPPLGAVALAGAVAALLLAVLAAGGIGPADTLGRLYQVAAGVIAGACACQVVELSHFGPHEHWRSGLMILTAGALASLAGIFVRPQGPPATARHARQDRCTRRRHR